MLSNYQLNKALKEKQAKNSSLSKLASVSKQSFNTLIRGPIYSLGSIMQTKHNLRVVPSPNHPSALNNANYYSGGYITEHYSSKDLSKYRINAIQIELPSSMRHDSLIIETNAKKIASCIYEFYTINSFEMIRDLIESNKRLSNEEEEKLKLKINTLVPNYL